MKTVVKVSQRTDGTYVAWVPALPGCQAKAESRQEVMDKMEEAVVGYLASLDVPADLARRDKRHLLIA